MNIVVVGLNHKTAPVSVREKIYFPKSNVNLYKEFQKLSGVDEGVILSTCNRVELSCATQDFHRATESLSRFIFEYHGLDPSQWSHHLYTLKEKDAVRHTFRVASSLDSMVIGEPQILGQVKEAFRASQEEKILGPSLHHLYEKAFKVAKRVRSETLIGSQAISVGSVAVQLCQKIFKHLESKKLLLVGGGEVMQTVANVLYKKGLRKFYIANRSQISQTFLPLEAEVQYISLESLPRHLSQMDMMIVSTSSPNYLLTSAMMEQAIRERKQQPIFCIDLSVPRNIDPEVHHIDNVYLYNVDDLANIVNENIKYREAEAFKAEKIIEEEVNKFLLKFA